MQRVLRIAAAGVAGAVIGYFIGATIGCDWLYPTSNLCGLYGALLTGPLGLVVGIVMAWRSTR